MASVTHTSCLMMLTVLTAGMVEGSAVYSDSLTSSVTGQAGPQSHHPVSTPSTGTASKSSTR